MRLVRLMGGLYSGLAMGVGRAVVATTSAPALQAPRTQTSRQPGRSGEEWCSCLRPGSDGTSCRRSCRASEGVTCWRRLRGWTGARWGSPTCEPSKGDYIGPCPVDPGRPGSKYHLIVEANGIPLQVTVTSGNRNDVTELLPLVHAIPPIRGLRGRSRHKPRELFADRDYDHDKYRRLLRPRGMSPRIARRGIANGSGQGKHRWVVERGFAVAPRLQAAPHSVGAPRRPPLRAPTARLRAHLLPATSPHYEMGSKKGPGHQ